MMTPGDGEHVGILIRRARENRAIPIDAVARANLLSLGFDPPTCGDVTTWCTRWLNLEETGYGVIAGDVILASRVIGVSDQERDGWFARAGLLPSKLHTLLLAHPEKWDAIRVLLVDENPPVLRCAVCGFDAGHTWHGPVDAPDEHAKVLLHVFRPFEQCPGMTPCR